MNKILFTLAVLINVVNLNSGRLVNTRRSQQFSFRPSSASRVLDSSQSQSSGSIRDARLVFLEQRLTRKFHEKFTRLKLSQNWRISRLEQKVGDLTDEVRNRSRLEERLSEDNQDLKRTIEVQTRKLNEVLLKVQQLNAVVKNVTSDADSRPLIGLDNDDVTSIDGDVSVISSGHPQLPTGN